MHMVTNRDYLILVIEDDFAIRELIFTALTEEGYRVETSDNGIEGKNMAIHFHPAVIILDLFIGGMNMLDVLASLRANLETKDIPIIVTSATVPERLPNEYQVVISQADRYLQKPFDLDELLDCVNDLAGRTAHPAVEDQNPADPKPVLPSEC